MSFDTRHGTRGARQPGGRLMMWINGLMMRRIRRRDRAMGFDALVLTTVGRTSGAGRRTPVGWFPDGDGYLVVASAAGAPRHPDWYLNLAAHPDQVRVETGGRTVAVTAEELHGTERDDAWRRITSIAPRFAQYQEKTDRVLPVIRLKPRE